MTPRCPSCLREQMVNHPAGVATFDHSLSCPLLAAEDATRAADHERLAPRGGLIQRTISRPTTETERTLLAAAGITLPPSASTTVERITPAVLRRTWPGATFDTPTTPSTTDGGDPS